MQLSIIFVILGLVAVENSAGIGQLSTIKPSQNDKIDQSLPQEVKPNPKPCKPIKTTSSTATSSTTEGISKKGGATPDDCEPVPEGIGSRLDAQTLRTLVTKEYPINRYEQ
ncbi:uncharacterized protein LOC108115614 [Drosophila eugracilis]|uniref:uncharacterized protein LOC108115614 n=1 Tax=Drosophila eugracilis TaxID=29029 RepID=UPI0007E6AEEE|nr:uncharacterized protein LOC108115614 [Drosophila eugracilis]